MKDSDIDKIILLIILLALLGMTLILLFFPFVPNDIPSFSH